MPIFLNQLPATTVLSRSSKIISDDLGKHIMPRNVRYKVVMKRKIGNYNYIMVKVLPHKPKSPRILQDV